MPELSRLESAAYSLVPERVRKVAESATRLTGTQLGRHAMDVADTLVTQQVKKKKDGWLMNGIQMVSPRLYDGLGLTDGKILHLPIALLFPKQYKAARLSKEASGNGKLGLVELAGSLLAPNVTKWLQVARLMQQGKIQISPQSFNILN